MAKYVLKKITYLLLLLTDCILIWFIYTLKAYLTDCCFSLVLYLSGLAERETRSLVFKIVLCDVHSV